MKLTNDWIVGFVDGDGCFSKTSYSSNPKGPGPNKVPMAEIAGILLPPPGVRSGLVPTGPYPNQTPERGEETHASQKALGALTRYSFVVSQDKRSENVLYALKAHFQCGNVCRTSGNMMEYRVQKKEHLKNIILPFFLKNTLRTEKLKDFVSFYNELMNESLDVSTLKDCGGVGVGLVWVGLGKVRVRVGPEGTLPKPKPTLTLPLPYPNSQPLSLDWLAGFTDAEGCFYVSIIEHRVRPQFLIRLQERDQQILESIKTFLGEGIVYRKKGNLCRGSKKPYWVYQASSVKAFDVVINALITNNNNCRLKTTKRLAFLQFKRIIGIVKLKQHLTPFGLEKITKLKAFMNKF
jgi:hypothetical protein